jgi:hypothetical protein
MDHWITRFQQDRTSPEVKNAGNEWLGAVHAANF